MINKVYGHVGDVRERTEGVEFRVERFAAKLGDRLAALYKAAAVKGPKAAS
jgi:hypothetical protein